MAQDIENKVEETEEVKAAEVAEEEEVEAPVDEDGDGIDEEELIEAGYRVHKFSLFDSPIEIATVLFMVAYVIFAFCSFAFDNPNGTGFMNIVEFLFDVVIKLIPAGVLLVACEIHEKVEFLEYNLSLNSEYMARYQMDLMDKLEKKDK